MNVVIKPIVDNFIPLEYATVDSACIDLNCYLSAKDDEGKYILKIYDRSGKLDEERARRIIENESSLVLSQGERALVSAGFKCELPKGYEMQIRPRSGLALKNGITIVNSPGTIDADYRGPVGVILLNTGREFVSIKDLTRIAQAGLHKVTQMEFLYTASELSETGRGQGGFGHTGVTS